jgi:Uncharacterized protein conserved in bacteria
MIQSVSQIAAGLANYKDDTFGDFVFSVNLINTEFGDVIEVFSNDDSEKVPVYIHKDDEQIRVVSELWPVSYIKPELRELVWVDLLKLSLIMPLSSFGIDSSSEENTVVLFGSLSSESSLNNLAEEVLELISNAKEAIKIGVDFLQ